MTFGYFYLEMSFLFLEMSVFFTQPRRLNAQYVDRRVSAEGRAFGGFQDSTYGATFSRKTAILGPFLTGQNFRAK